MRWEVLKIYQTLFGYEGDVYRVSCEKEDDGFALLINGEFVCDMETLPTREELIEHIKGLKDIESDIDRLEDLWK